MKIFYAVQATGNGHISRANQIYPYLKKYGEVDFLLSGCNANLHLCIEAKYTCMGCSLHYDDRGGLHYPGIIKNLRPYGIYKDASALPLENYDVIINDFDIVTAIACKLKKVPSVQFGHQASFQSKAAPRPDKKNIMGEMILKYFAPASQYIGLHFRPYDTFILPPVIKKEFIEGRPENQNM